MRSQDLRAGEIYAYEHRRINKYSEPTRVTGWKIYRDEQYGAAWSMVRAISRSIRDVVDGSEGATS